MKLVNFKAHEEEIERWKREAHREELSFSAWIRKRLNLPPAATLASIASEISSMSTSRAGVRPAAGCIHRLPKGAWCKTCQAIKK